MLSPEPLLHIMLSLIHILPKQYLLLNGKPVLYYSLKAMEDSFIDAVILVCGAGEDLSLIHIFLRVSLQQRNFLILM